MSREFSTWICFMHPDRVNISLQCLFLYLVIISLHQSFEKKKIFSIKRHIEDWIGKWEDDKNSLCIYYISLFFYFSSSQENIFRLWWWRIILFRVLSSLGEILIVSVFLSVRPTVCLSVCDAYIFGTLLYFKFCPDVQYGPYNLWRIINAIESNEVHLPKKFYSWKYNFLTQNSSSLCSQNERNSAFDFFSVLFWE